MNNKNVLKKTGFGILFVAACFIAAYMVMAFHGELLMVGIAAALLIIAAFLFLYAIFSEKAKNVIVEEEEKIDSKEVLPGSADGEFRLKIFKHMKEMENTQKELIEVLKTQNALLKGQLENMEHEIYMLSEKQINQTKSVIKFNKENARQLAISERETLEYVMMELKKAIENISIESVVTENNSDYGEIKAELEEVSEEELFEVSDLLDDEEFIMPSFPAEEESPAVPEEVPVFAEAEESADIPEVSDDLDLSALFEDIAETAAEDFLMPEAEALEEVVLPEALQEETVEESQEEAAPAVDPLAGLGGDPNAMMTPEDIAKLLASMGQ